MAYDRDVFFQSVRGSLFMGDMTQRQVDGMNFLLDIWEEYFEHPAGRQSTPWLAYCFATVYHETAQKMVPLEEYGRGEDHDYGEPTGPYEQSYYGRGHVQLTWEENYQKAEGFLSDRYKLEVPLHRYPHRMLEDETSALVLYDGMIFGWFTGVGLADYFNDDKEDPVHARQIVNAMDKAEQIAEYYWSFKEALQR